MTISELTQTYKIHVQVYKYVDIAECTNICNCVAKHKDIAETNRLATDLECPLAIREANYLQTR